MTGTFHIYDGDICIEDIEVTYDYHIENDGIGSYEYWGFKGYDKGTDYLVVENVKLIKNDTYSEEDVKYIEKHIKENYETICEHLEEQCQQHLENERQSYWEGVAEDRYYRDKYGY